MKREQLQDQLCVLEASVRQTAEACKAASRASTAKEVLTAATRDLITRRRGIQYSEQHIARTDRASLSKLIQKSIRKDVRAHKREEVAEKVAAFKDLRSISGIKKRRKKHNMVSIKDAGDRLQTSRQDIMDVFADFYEELYKSHADNKYNAAIFSSTSKIEDITEGEVRMQLKKMRKNKSGDSAGLVVEMLQYGSQELCGILAKLFSKILRFELEPPEAWKESLISVLYKKAIQRCQEIIVLFVIADIVQVVCESNLRKNHFYIGASTNRGPSRISSGILLRRSSPFGCFIG